jgi:hypothetical protein
LPHRANSSAAAEQIGKRLARDAKGLGRSGDGEPQTLEALLPDDLTRMSRLVHLRIDEIDA